MHNVTDRKGILGNPCESYRRNQLTVWLERTGCTISGPATLKEELAEIRTDGYAITWGGQVLGIGRASVTSVVEYDFLGSVGIVVPTGRIRDEAY